VDYVLAQARVNYRRIVRYNLPHLYDTKVRWVRTRPFVAPMCDGDVCEKPEKADLWRDIQQVYRDLEGDCKDLVAIRLAERWLLGDVDARPETIRYPDALGPGYDLFHVVLVHGDGTVEDPSAYLGMTGVG
jgi:hypothetical protein